MFTGDLPSGSRACLATVGQSFFDVWNAPNSALGAFPHIGSPFGPRPSTINGRVMAALGAYGYLEPFSLLQKSVNVAKGNLFGLKMPVDLNIIDQLVAEVMRLDTKEAADKLLSTIRTVFAVFEYLNTPKVSLAWAAVNSQMRLQLSYVEKVTGIRTLQIWWDAWLADFSDTISKKGQDWAYSAIAKATMAIYNANKAAVDAGRPQPTMSELLTGQLGQFSDSMKKMRVPSLPQIPLLPPPGGLKSDVLGNGSWMGPDMEKQMRLELDEVVWERSISDGKIRGD
ncbi:MAG: hypothetical protein Q9160_006879 [Pyrenula sp. 1 TL-2023]